MADTDQTTGQENTSPGSTDGDQAAETIFGKPAEKIVIKEIEEGEDIAYYRDENDVHYVPKRKLSDIILKK